MGIVAEGDVLAVLEGVALTVLVAELEGDKSADTCTASKQL